MNKLLSSISIVLTLISYGTHAMEETEDRRIAFSGRLSSQFEPEPKSQKYDCCEYISNVASSVVNGVGDLCSWVVRNPKTVLTFGLLALPSVGATTSSSLNPQMCFPARCGDSPNTFLMTTICDRAALQEGSARLTDLCRTFPDEVDSRFNLANLAAFRADYLNEIALYVVDDPFRHKCIKTEGLKYKSPKEVPTTQVDFNTAKCVEQGYYATAGMREVLFTGSVSNCVAVGISGKTNQGQIESWLGHVDQGAIDAMDLYLTKPKKKQNSPFGDMDDFILAHENVNIFLVSGEIAQLSYMEAFLEDTWGSPIEVVYHRPWSATLSGEESEGNQGTLIIKNGKFYLAKDPEKVRRKMKLKAHKSTGKPVPLKPMSEFKQR